MRSIKFSALVLTCFISTPTLADSDQTNRSDRVEWSTEYNAYPKWFIGDLEEELNRDMSDMGIINYEVDKCRRAIPLAEQGIDFAQLILGYGYQHGVCVDQDYEEALFWYRKAANQGNDRAQSRLGDMYSAGLGVEQDYEEAAKWYRKSADQNYGGAQYALGAMYSKGLGVEQDHEKAVGLLSKAYEVGYSKAQSEYNDFGTLPENHYYLERSQLALSKKYLLGQGKHQDIPKAYALTKAAASSDYALAQLELGFMHSRGIGTPKDYNEAMKWFKAAKESADAKLNWSAPEDTKVLKSVIRVAEIQIKILGLQ
jgi:TPR repeat protein